MYKIEEGRVVRRDFRRGLEEIVKLSKNVGLDERCWSGGKGKLDIEKWNRI